MAREMKSSGVEWIGDIPADWNICHFRNIANIFNGNSIKDDEKANYEDSTEAVPYIATKDIDAIFQTIDYGNGMYVKKNDNNFKHAPKHSVLLCIEGGSAGKKIAFTNQEVCFINKLCCFYTESVVNRFLFYYMLSPAFTEEFKIHISGLIGGVSISEIKGFSFVVPTMKEQNSIFAFLDKKCAEIDAVIEKTKATIEEYKKLKQSVITEAVTKGIRGDRPMKDSGIEWIGEIAETHPIIKLKYVCQILDQFRKPVTADQRSQNGDVLYDYYGASGVIDKIDDYTIDDHVMLIGEDGANLRMRNLPLMYEVNGKAWINNHAHILKPNEDTCFYYLFYALEVLDINPYITGSAQPKLSQDNLRNIWIPMPTYDEQKEIADYLEKKCAEIDSLITKKTNLLTELENYKKSLIYEYVTGKKECRERG